MEQKAYSFDDATRKKILKGVLIAGSGAMLAYLSEIAGQIDFGTYTVFIGALLSIAINAAQEYIAGKK